MMIRKFLLSLLPKIHYTQEPTSTNHHIKSNRSFIIISRHFERGDIYIYIYIYIYTAIDYCSINKFLNINGKIPNN